MACGYCYAEYHNRRTCPDYTKRLQDQAADGSTYAIDALATRGKGKTKSNRQCSFCSERGHDRRTCEKIKSIVFKEALAAQRGRRLVLNNAREHGFGVGSLLKFKMSGYDRAGMWTSGLEHVGIVTNILWDNISHKLLSGENNPEQVIMVQYPDYAGNCQDRWVPFPAAIVADGETEESEWSAQNRPEFIGPVSGPSTNPPGYLGNKTCEKMARRWVKDKKSWHFGY